MTLTRIAQRETPGVAPRGFPADGAAASGSDTLYRNALAFEKFLEVVHDPHALGNMLCHFADLAARILNQASGLCQMAPRLFFEITCHNGVVRQSRNGSSDAAETLGSFLAREHWRSVADLSRPRIEPTVLYLSCWTWLIRTRICSIRSGSLCACPASARESDWLTR
jgi:hypothetical protein